MKKLILSLLPFFFLVLKGSKADAQPPDSVQRFIDSALSIMQRHSMYANRVNWKRVKDSVALLSKNATTYAQTVTALRYAFNSLGDKHGWLVINGEAYKNIALAATADRVNNNMKAAASKGPRIYSGRVAKHYAYLSIPFFNNQTKEGANAFAQRLQDSLCGVMDSKTKGIILDLRLNAGGFTQAMLIGVSNVFGNQRPAPGKHYEGDWVIENYGTDVNDTFRIQLQRACGDYSRLPVAVLIGAQTASAGEFLALGFAARPNTVLIGEHTAGFTSGNNGFRLPGGGNGIVVAEEYAVDKAGKEYPDGLDPQITVVGGDDFFNRAKDRKVRAAVKWLKERKR